MARNEILDGTGLGCPMPVVRTKQAIDALAARVADLEARLDSDGRKLSVVATNRTFDMAYPPLVLSMTADTDVQLLV